MHLNAKYVNLLSQSEQFNLFAKLTDNLADVLRMIDHRIIEICPDPCFESCRILPPTIIIQPLQHLDFRFPPSNKSVNT